MKLKNFLISEALISKNYEIIFAAICEHFGLKLSSFGIKETSEAVITRAVLVIPKSAESYCVDRAPGKSSIVYSKWHWHSADMSENGNPYIVLS